MPRSVGVVEREAPLRPDSEGAEARSRALARYVILDTAPEEEFDDLASLAALVSGCPLAAIAFIDRDRPWMKAMYGFDGAAATRHAALSARALALAGVAESSLCVREQSDTTEPLPLASCVAEPLVTSDGFTLGYLMVMDVVPKELGERRRAALEALSRQVMALLELRRTLVGYHAVIDGAGLVVFHTDADGRLVSVTPTWAKLTGHGVVRSLGKPLRALINPGDAPTVEARLTELLHTKRAARLDCRIAKADGADLPVELYAQPLHATGDRPAGVVGVMADISERRAREIQDQHRQKLESLGRLAAGVAHEMNTPIQFVGDNTRYLADICTQLSEVHAMCREILATDLNADVKLAVLTQLACAVDLNEVAEEVPSAVCQTLEGVERVATIVRAMKAMSHPGHDQQASADINEALRATVAVARNEVKYDAEVVLDFGEIPPVVCYVADLSQVFLNLIINAADAIREAGMRGRITVTSECVDGDAVIRVSDTGHGIPPEVLPRIFDPFFTTKDVGRGTGQGLALAHAVVVQKHGGVIDVESVLGRGTTFTVRIPVAGVQEGNRK